MPLTPRSPLISPGNACRSTRLPCLGSGFGTGYIKPGANGLRLQGYSVQSSPGRPAGWPSRRLTRPASFSRPCSPRFGSVVPQSLRFTGLSCSGSPESLLGSAVLLTWLQVQQFRFMTGLTVAVGRQPRRLILIATS